MNEDRPATDDRPRCGKPAKWTVSGRLIAAHLCCQEHKEQWERLTNLWTERVIFEATKTDQTCEI